MDLLFLMTIVPAYLVGSFFVKNDPGPEEPRSGLNAAIGFGVISVVLALLFSLLMNLLVSGDILARISSTESDTQLPLIVDVLIFASIEEFVKFIPLAVFIMRKNFFNEVTDGIIYFTIVGLTFGAIESLLYGFGAGDAGVIVATVRLGLGLFFHGALTGLVGYTLAKSKVTNSGVPMVFLTLIGACLVHTAYNYFVYTAQNDPVFIFGAAAVALATNAAMFWMYYVATKRDIQLGLAGPQYMAERQQRELYQRQAAQQEYFARQNLAAPQPMAQPQPVAPQPVPPPPQQGYAQPQQHQAVQQEPVYGQAEPPVPPQQNQPPTV